MFGSIVCLALISRHRRRNKNTTVSIHSIASSVTYNGIVGAISRDQNKSTCRKLIQPILYKVDQGTLFGERFGRVPLLDWRWACLR